MAHSHGHNHGHSHAHPDLKGRNLIISILLNIVITIAQAVGGIFSGSLSLLSDALHNFSDVLSLIVSYFANLLSQKTILYEQNFWVQASRNYCGFCECCRLNGGGNYFDYRSN